MTSSLFVHIPAHFFQARLSFLLNRRLQPEIACQEVSIDQLDFKQLEECAGTLAAAQLGTSLHAPFIGFNPGHGRESIRNQSRELALQSLNLAKKIKAQKIIFHPGLPPECSVGQKDQWLLHNREFWPEIVAMAEANDCCLCLENIYETDPEPLLQLCKEISSPYFGHCFDIGHWNIFGAVSMTSWLDQMAPWLKHLHLHDNRGTLDEHLPIGRGNADFSDLFTWLKSHNYHSTMTLEAHNLPDLDISLEAIKQYLS